MKYLSTLLLFITLGFLSIAQTATDFTVNDCEGNSHNLFSELNSGKVIVICWVMPCASCVGPALTTKNVVQSFQSTNPDNVFYYLVDDYGTTPCSALNSWANSNWITSSNFSYRFSDPAIDMNDYGSEGMPKVVVLGGINHSVFYNANYVVNASALQNAIATALTSTDVNNISKDVSSFNIYPNPAQSISKVNFSLNKVKDITLEIYNLSGQKISSVYSGESKLGVNSFDINVANYDSGMYIIKLTDETNSQYLNLVVSH